MMIVSLLRALAKYISIYTYNIKYVMRERCATELLSMRLVIPPRLECTLTPAHRSQPIQKTNQWTRWCTKSLIEFTLKNSQYSSDRCRHIKFHHAFIKCVRNSVHTYSASISHITKARADNRFVDFLFSFFVTHLLGFFPPELKINNNFRRKSASERSRVNSSDGVRGRVGHGVHEASIKSSLARKIGQP